jgi:hypothetical protein
MTTEAVRERAKSAFKKEEQAREGAKARLDYEADSRATQEKTARLRALRLAKQAADAALVPEVVPPVAKTRARAKKERLVPASDED